jgi:putative hydrolase of the HAD superfamily
MASGAKALTPALRAHIKAVTFDVGGTLIEPWPSVGHVYAEVAARHGLKAFSPEQLNARFKTAWRNRERFNYAREDWAELVDDVFGDPVATAPGSAFFDELYQRFAQPDAWHVFDDVVPALDALAARGIRLAVISNWDERLRGLLSRLNLERYFEVLAISCEVGFPKPSRAIFQQAAADLDLRAGAILHVGDSFEMDIEGAKAAGFHALQIHRTAGEQPNNGLHSLADLPARIDDFNPDN